MLLLLGPHKLLSSFTARHATTRAQLVAFGRSNGVLRKEVGATIATATRPCLKKKRRHSRKAPQGPVKLSTKQKIAELKSKLDTHETGTEVLLSRERKTATELGKKLTVNAGPKEAGLVYSEEECEVILIEMQEEMISGIDNLPDKVTRERARNNLELIRRGGHTSYEIADAVHSVASKMEDDRLKNLVDKSRKRVYLIAPNFWQLMDEEVEKLPQELLAAVLTEVEQTVSDIFRPIDERITNTILEEMHVANSKEHTKRLRKAIFRTEKAEFDSSYGASMLPTMPFRSTFMATPLVLREGTPKMTMHNVKRDDIVTAVLCFRSRRIGWDSSWVVKRVKGLQGDVVEDIRGRKLIVPSGHCWLVGDNLEKSLDSRHWGSFPLTNLRSKVDETTIEDKMKPKPEPGIFSRLTNWFK